MIATNTMESSAFFYIDGIPTKGLWIDLMTIEGWQDVENLLAAKYPGSDSDDILCADIEGPGKLFYSSNCDGFSMNSWLEFRESLENTHLDSEAIFEYLECTGSPDNFDISDIEDSYYGQYDSMLDFAYSYIDDTAMLDGVPENLQCYFDYEKFANDLSYDFFITDSGYVFRNC